METGFGEDIDKSLKLTSWPTV